MNMIHEIKTTSFCMNANYEADKRTIFVYIEGLVHEPSAVETWLKILDFSKTSEVIGVVINSEKLKGTFTRMKDFFKDQVGPSLVISGVKYIYIGLTQDVFSRFAMNSLLKILTNKIEIKIFSTTLEAERLLHQKLKME